MNNQSSAVEIDVEALQRRDKKAFANLVEKYSDVIYRLAYRITENEQDAEDVLQETFIKVFQNIDRFKGLSSISTWIYRIASNEALMLLRRRKPEKVQVEIDQEVEEDSDVHPQQIKDWCCLPERELLSNESKKHLEEASSRLSSSLKMVFFLRDIEGLSIAETAEALNISEMAVKTRLSRARFFLREELSNYFLTKNEVGYGTLA